MSKTNAKTPFSIRRVQTLTRRTLPCVPFVMSLFLASSKQTPAAKFSWTNLSRAPLSCRLHERDTATLVRGARPLGLQIPSNLRSDRDNKVEWSRSFVRGQSLRPPVHLSVRNELRRNEIEEAAGRRRCRLQWRAPFLRDAIRKADFLGKVSS